MRLILKRLIYRNPYGSKLLKHINVTLLLAGIFSLVNPVIKSDLDLRGAGILTVIGQVTTSDSYFGEDIQLFMPLVNGYTSYKPGASDGSWPMAGANPQRNSWTSEEVKGHLIAEWFKPFEPYIMEKVQIIADNGKLYISTAKGLYALDASTGEQVWVYPTEMPLGHSPTIHEGVAYVGGFDHKLHAIDADSGGFLWSFTASAGFDTNPLVINNKAYLGNRDGYFYAINIGEGIEGTLAWKFKTNGPIHFSAAYQDGKVYFASNDSYAYALDAESGELVWRSAKLSGAGFHSWWPIIYGDRIIFAGSNNYSRMITKLNIRDLERDDVYPNNKHDPRGTLVGPLGSTPGFWAPDTPTIDTSKSTITPNGKTTPIVEYFESKPWRRTYFVLNLSSGIERTYDFDSDGKFEYAPILWFGTHSGNRYPPIVGSDGIIYQGNSYYSDMWIPGGNISGWQVDSPHISIVNSGWNAVDEPIAYSAGGNLIYMSLCCDRASGAIDISIPVRSFQSQRETNAEDNVQRSWNYFSYNLPDKVPGYNTMTYVWNPYYKPAGGVYGGRNGSYGFHGDVNPPIPYKGKVYMHRGNSIIAFSRGTGEVRSLPVANIVESSNTEIPPLNDDQIISFLESEIKKILSAGHLRPGHSSTGILDAKADKCGADLLDYWHNPSDTIYTLIRALPHLPTELYEGTKAYIQNEFSNYPPYIFDHIGWKDGKSRHEFDLPPETEAGREKYGSKESIEEFNGWTTSPFTFYALWKYVEEFGNAKTIFDLSKNRIEPVPYDVLLEMPHVHNAYIAGYIGYLELEKLSGYPESTQIKDELENLLDLRASMFSKDTPEIFLNKEENKDYCRSFNSSRNFMYMVPELADYLRNNALSKVQAAVNEYERVTPLWFATNIETAYAEGTINHLYDVNAVFQAKALILDESREEMTKYLDVPAFPRGDLFYIQNLVSLLETSP
jgi:outer membrane protein assembly factor BamB